MVEGGTSLVWILWCGQPPAGVVGGTTRGSGTDPQCGSGLGATINIPPRILHFSVAAGFPSCWVPILGSSPGGTTQGLGPEQRDQPAEAGRIWCGQPPWASPRWLEGPFNQAIFCPLALGSRECPGALCQGGCKEKPTLASQTLRRESLGGWGWDRLSPCTPAVLLVRVRVRSLVGEIVIDRTPKDKQDSANLYSQRTRQLNHLRSISPPSGASP